MNRVLLATTEFRLSSALREHFGSSSLCTLPFVSLCFSPSSLSSRLAIPSSCALPPPLLSPVRPSFFYSHFLCLDDRNPLILRYLPCSCLSSSPNVRTEVPAVAIRRQKHICLLSKFTLPLHDCYRNRLTCCSIMSVPTCSLFTS